MTKQRSEDGGPAGRTPTSLWRRARAWRSSTSMERPAPRNSENWWRVMGLYLRHWRRLPAGVPILYLRHDLDRLKFDLRRAGPCTCEVKAATSSWRHPTILPDGNTSG